MTATPNPLPPIPSLDKDTAWEIGRVEDRLNKARELAFCALNATCISEGDATVKAIAAVIDVVITELDGAKSDLRAIREA